MSEAGEALGWRLEENPIARELSSRAFCFCLNQNFQDGKSPLGLNPMLFSGVNGADWW
jgi:hypothetical protein